jgi:Matrixin
MTGDRVRSRLFHRAPSSKAFRPRLEVLEDRFLLYATTGNQWTKPNLITYSFMPDGTSLGGIPSNLQATLNAHFSTASWQAQFADAAAVWEEVANVNFSLVADNGSPLGVSGNQQDDPRFGDIRIGGYAMSSSILAFAYLPPPANGGTDAGDIFFNTAQSWQINGTTYDLMTVAIHELGHALGMGHSTDTAAAMYPAYLTTKQAVDADDISGIRSIYNARQPDIFNTNTSNGSPRSAANISSYIGTNMQLSISGLDLTPPATIGTNDIEWYKITVPASTTGTMVVRMQSAGLSLLAPSLAAFNSAGNTILGQQISYNLGDTVTVAIKNVSPGQVYDIRCQGSTTGPSGFGTYGLQVNFGSLTQSPIPRPNTTVAQAPDQGGGTLPETGGSSTASTGQLITVGSVTGWGDPMMLNAILDRQLDMGTAENLAPWTPLWLPPLPISAFVPAFGTDQSSQNVTTTLSFFTEDNDQDAVLPMDVGTAENLAPGTPLWQPPLPITAFVPAFGTDQSSQNVIRTLGFFTEDNDQDAFLPTLTLPKNQGTEAMQYETVDRMLDGWSLDPQS